MGPRDWGRLFSCSLLSGDDFQGPEKLVCDSLCNIQELNMDIHEPRSRIQTSYFEYLENKKSQVCKNK